jgi:hypothetical protein
MPTHVDGGERRDARLTFMLHQGHAALGSVRRRPKFIPELDPVDLIVVPGSTPHHLWVLSPL